MVLPLRPTFLIAAALTSGILATSYFSPIAPVTVQLFGDSTQVGMCYSILQAEMEARFGKGRVKILCSAVPGTSSEDLVRGADSLNKPWPQSVIGDIAVVNHGINDQQLHTPLQRYNANISAFASGPAIMVLETSSPLHKVAYASREYTDLVREAAFSKKIPLADVDAYVRTIPRWETFIPDGVHPNPELQELIAKNVIAVVLDDLVIQAAYQRLKNSPFGSLNAVTFMMFKRLGWSLKTTYRALFMNSLKNSSHQTSAGN